MAVSLGLLHPLPLLRWLCDGLDILRNPLESLPPSFVIDDERRTADQAVSCASIMAGSQFLGTEIASRVVDKFSRARESMESAERAALQCSSAAVKASTHSSMDVIGSTSPDGDGVWESESMVAMNQL